MQRETESPKLPLGAKLPFFELPNVDNRKVGSDYLKNGKAALVVFTCNHCPYVKGSEQMFIATVKEFEAKGLKAVAISANDALQYPEDGFELMQVKAKELNLPYPYLFDESQEVAKAFDAQCTPECYLFDSEQKLIYHGKINDNPKDPTQAKQNHLKVALEQFFSGQQVNPAFVHPLGCSIKWRK